MFFFWPRERELKNNCCCCCFHFNWLALQAGSGYTYYRAYCCNYPEVRGTSAARTYCNRLLQLPNEIKPQFLRPHMHVQTHTHWHTHRLAHHVAVFLLHTCYREPHCENYSSEHIRIFLSFFLFLLSGSLLLLQRSARDSRGFIK